jgi:F-type H+-transporting ATPase subunit delta
MPGVTFRGVSEESFAAGQDRLETLLASPGTDASALGGDLFSVTDLLASNPALRRALTDPAREGQAKADLVERLLGGQVSGPAVDVVAGLARGRWSRSGDLTEAVEAYAVTSVLAGAERAGRLDAVEDELFRFARIIEGDQNLRDAFSYRTEGADRKGQLVRQLLGGRAAPETVRLAVQAAAHPRGLRTEQVLEQLVQAAADRRQQLVAHVVAAAPLTTEQRGRLEAALQRRYGRVRLNIDVDPEVMGGLRVQVGSELVDGTVTARLDEARRRMAG